MPAFVAMHHSSIYIPSEELQVAKMSLTPNAFVLQLVVPLLSLVETWQSIFSNQLHTLLLLLVLITSLREVGVISPTRVIGVGIWVISYEAYRLQILRTHLESMWLSTSNTANSSDLIHCIQLVVIPCVDFIQNHCLQKVGHGSQLSLQRNNRIVF